MSCHCLLVSIISNVKSAVDLTEVPLYMVSHFFLDAFTISLCV